MKMIVYGLKGFVYNKNVNWIFFDLNLFML